jgi:hypothetical protein
MRFRNSLLASICIVGLQVGMVPTQCRAAEPAAILQHALGSQEALYKFSPETLAGAVKRCAGEDPTHAGTYVALVLRSGRPDADAIAPALVTAAIQGLGADPSRDQVAGIVRLSVYSAPSEVLDIVTAAVKASPRSAAPAIVTAAVSTVPHPERLVTVNVERRAARAPGNDKQTDNKQLADDKSVTPPEQKHLTLAEAIVQAALNADPGLSESSLAAAADNGLNFAFATSRPPVLTGVLAPIIPVLPSIPSTGAGSTSVTFSGPGPVSP